MKRLMIVTDAWHPQINGVVRVLEQLRRELPPFGIEVEMLSPDGFRSVPLPTYSEIRLVISRPSAIARRIEGFAPDFIHIATEGPLGTMARQWCLKNRKGFTTSFHTRFPEYLAARLPVPVSVSYAWLRRFHNAGLATMVSTERLAGELRERGFDKLRIWTRAVDTDRFTPGEPAELGLAGPIFLYVGRVAVEKGISNFLSLDLPGTKVVVGDGPQRAELQRRFPDVKFLGVKTGDELVRIYRAADVFVFPSRTDTLGLVMMEAMACGTPVAAYPVTGPLDVVADSGAGVLDEDLRAAALAALEIPRDKCLERSRDFSWQSSASSFVEGLFEANGELRMAA
ncbi:glycosyltransferase family 4 protein [Lutibaculum baratangense]|uniref:Glycosyltransferase n=1 Tax=Lutibaculum baratangense AMV1 TaxID=631454 RepID=V4RLW0_9HYPH|nr:glycosyltransferase family 1 protein [Lutibaculum baratangense]ESR24235.1 Glycosyltransferase [Lutibaculum baratangense AMV1]